MDNKFIEFRNVSFIYDKNKILDNISFSVDRGEFLSIVGRNGSGKSVLVKHINGLLLPSSGDVFVDGINTKDNSRINDIRQKVGFIFQDPDNQIVASTVEEDIAFGLSNLGTHRDIMRKKIDETLKIFNISEYKDYDVENLSGGTKQKVSLAGVIAMDISCLVLDEPTSMLDPESCQIVMDEIIKLNKKHNISIILLTHHMNEAKLADKTIILDHGKILMQGSPDIIDTNFINDNNSITYDFSRNIDNQSDVFVELRNISYRYSKHSDYIIKNLDFKIFKNDMLIITGKNGSGKSTLAKIVSGIISPNSGDIFINEKKVKKNELSKKVKIVFQSSESQLFAETVLDDVCFGARNLGFSNDDSKKLAIDSLRKLGFNIDKIGYSPFELSGGEKKIVSIAGILVMDPEVLILDEPTAGLDFFAKRELIKTIIELNKNYQKTILIISHSYDLFKNICKETAKIKLSNSICKVLRI